MRKEVIMDLGEVPKRYYVYLHIREDTGEVFYVGKGTKSRWKNLEGRNRHWKHIFEKTQVFCTLAANDLTEDQALAYERDLIFLFGRKDIGTGYLVNMTEGGDGVVNYVFTDEHRRKLSVAGTGRKHTEDHKKWISEFHKGRTFSEETRKKMSESRKGWKLTDEQKAALLGRANSKSKKVLCTTTGEVFNTVSDAARKLCLDSSGVHKVCSGKRKHYKGLQFKFVEEETS